MRQTFQTGVLVATVFLALVGAAHADSTVTFNYTGGEQTVAIPTGVTSGYITASGGMGAPEPVVPPSIFGGYGAVVSGTVTVEPGSTLYIEVGGNGHYIQGGFNGGGLSGGTGGAGGGGASDVQTCSINGGSCASGNALASRLLIAAGGGGSGAPGNVTGGGQAGAGGSASELGATGGQGGGSYGGQGGGAGTATRGGTGGTDGNGGAPAGAGQSGTLGMGGSWNTEGLAPGGGGGGGLYGGGGGGAGNAPDSGCCEGGGGGGGGGSSLVPTGGSFAIDSTGTPTVKITIPTPLLPPGNQQPPSIGGGTEPGDQLSCEPGIWMNSPSNYSYAWLRNGIDVATGQPYTIAAGDVGTELVCSVTATNAGGSTAAASAPVTVQAPASPPPPTSTGPSPPTGPSSPTIAQIEALLRREITPRGKTAKIAVLLKRKGCKLSFRALTEGNALVSWYLVPSGAHLAGAKAKPGAILIAHGSARFSRAETLQITMRLTANGMRFLRQARRLKLVAKGTFAPGDGRLVIATRSFTLRRWRKAAGSAESSGHASDT
jgi:hypothetical protein